MKNGLNFKFLMTHVPVNTDYITNITAEDLVQDVPVETIMPQKFEQYIMVSEAVSFF